MVSRRWWLLPAMTAAFAVSCTHTPAGPAATLDSPPAVPATNAGCGAASGATAAVEPLDLTHDGVFRSGHWEYRYTIIAPGTKSQGARGELLFDGVPVDIAVAEGAWHCTPWGAIQWVGDPVTMWSEHGWMPRDPGVTGGTRLDP